MQALFRKTDIGRLCVAVVRSGRVDPPVEWLAGRMLERHGMDAPEFESLLIRAFDTNDIEPWTRDAGPDRITLAPHTADWLSVRHQTEAELAGRRDEHGLEAGGSGWAKIHRRRTVLETDLRGKIRDDDPWSLGSIPDDDAMGPEDSASVAEHAERLASKHARARRCPADRPWVPLPSVLLGERLQWPVGLVRQAVAIGDRDGWHAPKVFPWRLVCQACRERLRPWEYCLACDRFGLERLLPRAETLPAEKAEAAEPRRVVPGAFGRYAPPVPVKARRGA